MRYPIIEHHGAKDGVTGSYYQLHMNASTSVSIDCGLFQGNDASLPGGSDADRLAIEFPLDTVKALIATHVHIDHVGWILYLLAAGFEGPNLCSEASGRLLPIELEDAFKLGISRDQASVERYIERIKKRLILVPYQHWFTLFDSDELVARVRFQRAGHILGSAYIEIDLSYPQQNESKRLVFSGGIGAPHAPIPALPHPPERADILVLESTYGDRLHEDCQNHRQRLEAVIEHVGDQAKGTPGHAIQTYGPKGGYVGLDGERIDIRAGIHQHWRLFRSCGSVEFVSGMQQWPTEKRMVLGEQRAKHVLAGQLRKCYTSHDCPLADVITVGVAGNLGGAFSHFQRENG